MTTFRCCDYLIYIFMSNKILSLELCFGTQSSITVCLYFQADKQFKFKSVIIFYLFQKFGFPPCRAEQPLQGRELQEKKEKDKKQRGKPLRENPRKKGIYLL